LLVKKSVEKLVSQQVKNNRTNYGTK